MKREEEIQLIAYSIWEQEGCCNGSDVEHWLRAEAIWEEKREKEHEIASKKIRENSGQSMKHVKKNRVARKKS